jgi:predicted nucleic acid-binding protein
MSGTKRKVYYWDACIYLAHIKNEVSHGKHHLDAISQIAKENFENKNLIITSVITLTEVLSSSLTAEQEEAFLKTFKSTNHTLYDVDYAIARKARRFREAFLHHSSSKKLTTPDAIHAATAAIYQVDEMNTFDDGKKEKKFLGLLELNKHSDLDNLTIVKPTVEVIDLFASAVPTHPKT